MQLYPPTSYAQPYDPALYTLTTPGEVLIWRVVVQPGEQVYIWRGSNLTTGETADGGRPKQGSPAMLVLALEQDGTLNWTAQVGIGPTGAAAAPAGLVQATFPIPQGPAGFPVANGIIPMALANKIIVAHDGLIASTLRVIATVAAPGCSCQ